MGRKGHSLSNIDHESLTGECSVCRERVPVRKRGGAREGFYCVARLRETERNRSPQSREAKKAWWAANGHLYPTRDARYKTADGTVSFKLSKAEREALIEGKTCQVCGGGYRLVIDHCHETGKFRGVLCNSCNLALGLVQDSIGRLMQMVEYLQA